MACLAFGRAALLSHPSFGGGGGGDDVPLQLTVAEERRTLAAEALVFDALAMQATAFICNLDEATVNCGAAEPHILQMSSSSGSGSSSSSGGGGAGAGGGSLSGAACPPCPPAGHLFRRLRSLAKQADEFDGDGGGGDDDGAPLLALRSAPHCSCRC